MSAVDMSVLDEARLSELDAFIESREDVEGSLIGILHHAQNLFGYLPEALQVYIGRKTGISTAKIYGVVTFYSFFNTEPRGKHTISVCMGTACFVKGAEDILSALKEELDVELGEITKDGMFMVEQVHCLGACSLAPVLSIDGHVYGKVKKDQLHSIIEGYYISESSEGREAVHVD